MIICKVNKKKNYVTIAGYIQKVAIEHAVP